MTQTSITIFAPSEDLSFRCDTSREGLFGVNVCKDDIFDMLWGTRVWFWSGTEFAIATEAPGPCMSLWLCVKEGGGEEEGGGDCECWEQFGSEHVDMYLIIVAKSKKSTKAGNRTPILGFKVRCPHRWTT